MQSILHITNGDCAGDLIRASGIAGDVLAWRDILHEGPVLQLPLTQLSLVRADFLAGEGLGEAARIRADFAERDSTLMRFAFYDQVVLWFEWDLYDQLQLIQLLDFFSANWSEDSSKTHPRLDVVCIEGYLGNTAVEDYPSLFEKRTPVTGEMLKVGRDAWRAFTSSDPQDVELFISGDTTALPFLRDAFFRALEEFPSARNGLSRSESQLLEAVSGGPLEFTELFKRVSQREARVFCGDMAVAGYLERMSAKPEPLVSYASGDRIRHPRDGEDSAAFRNAQVALTEAGRSVLAGERDWIDMGGADRWLGGVHLQGRNSPWRWDSDAETLRMRDSGVNG